MTILYSLLLLILIFYLDMGVYKLVVFYIYYMAVSQKDWEILNSQILSADIDIDRSLDFPI